MKYQRVDESMPEKEFQRIVVQLARLRGWTTYHTHDSRRSDEGFPDLVCVRERIIYVELKSEDGKVRPEQKEWLMKIRDAGGEAYLWRPSDWDIVAITLAPRARVR